MHPMSLETGSRIAAATQTTAKGETCLSRAARRHWCAPTSPAACIRVPPHEEEVVRRHAGSFCPPLAIMACCPRREPPGVNTSGRRRHERRGGSQLRRVPRGGVPPRVGRLTRAGQAAEPTRSKAITIDGCEPARAELYI